MVELFSKNVKFEKSKVFNKILFLQSHCKYKTLYLDTTDLCAHIYIIKALTINAL